MYTRGWIRAGLISRVTFGSLVCVVVVSMSIYVLHVKESGWQSWDSDLDIMTVRCGTFSWCWMLPSMSWRDLGTLSELLSSSLAHVQFISISHIEPSRVTARPGSFVACLLLSACSPDSSVYVHRGLSDEAVLSKALHFAFPRHAWAIVGVCACWCVRVCVSSILSCLWAWDLSLLFFFLECFAHSIPGKILCFVS